MLPRPPPPNTRRAALAWSFAATLAACASPAGDDRRRETPPPGAAPTERTEAPRPGASGRTETPRPGASGRAETPRPDATPGGRAEPPPADVTSPASVADALPPAGPADAALPPAARPLRRDTPDDLLALVAPLLAPPASAGAGERAMAFWRRNVAPGSPARMNQGNPALARHAIDGAACRRGLEGVTLQTPEQRAACGAENMVPLFRDGRGGEARTCIDVFEFPNVACELPLVWASPTQAQGMCEAAGKRLCAQDEWQLACAGDPAGGPDRRYAYGDELDLEACNTNKPAASFEGPPCDAGTAQSAWRTCRTNTEPAGSFPRCRSRFGAFDLHGNVAEIMTRRDETGRAVSQLKGSAFFYADVARSHDAPRPPRGARETYPDHCAYDPRWHVEPMASARHVNYHLGFRCCKTVTPALAPPPEARAPDARPRRASARVAR